MHVTVADLQDYGNGPGVRGQQEQAHQPGVVQQEQDQLASHESVSLLCAWPCCCF